VIFPFPKEEGKGGREGGPKLLLSLRKACRMVVGEGRECRRREEEGEEEEDREEEGLRKKAVVLVVLLPRRRRRRREAVLLVVVGMVLYVWVGWVWL